MAPVLFRGRSPLGAHRRSALGVFRHESVVLPCAPPPCCGTGCFTPTPGGTVTAQLEYVQTVTFAGHPGFGGTLRHLITKEFPGPGANPCGAMSVSIPRNTDLAPPGDFFSGPAYHAIEGRLGVATPFGGLLEYGLWVNFTATRNTVRFFGLRAGTLGLPSSAHPWHFTYPDFDASVPLGNCCDSLPLPNQDLSMDDDIGGSHINVTTVRIRVTNRCRCVAGGVPPITCPAELVTP